MADFLNQAWIRVVTAYAGQLCHTNLYYQNSDTVLLNRQNNILTAFLTDVLPDWTPLLVADAVITEAHIAVYHMPSQPAPEIAVQYPGAAGEQVGDGLPAFVTATLLKVPNNATLSPPTGTPFVRAGRIAISGIPESAQANGAIDSTYEGLMTNLALALMDFTVTISGTPHTFNLGMVKSNPTPGTGTTGVLVSGLNIGRIGTQNTRK